jgi:hypothetical protein
MAATIRDLRGPVGNSPDLPGQHDNVDQPTAGLPVPIVALNDAHVADAQAFEDCAAPFTGARDRI